MRKDRMSYYDMDPRTAQMYKPIDKYLRQSSRFSNRAMKRGLVLRMLLLAVVLLFFLFITVVAFRQGTLAGYVAFVLMLIFDFGFGAAMYSIPKDYGKTIDPDMTSCENILDRDGMEEVYRDFNEAVFLTDRSKLGKKYIFIYGRTLVRLQNITDMQPFFKEIISDDIKDVICVFRIHVTDEMGCRTYDLEVLGDNENKRQQRFAELKTVIENSQKRIEQIDL